MFLKTSTLMLGVVLSTSLVALPAVAGQLADGRAFFDKSPTLVRAAAIDSESLAPEATYEFTIAVPDKAGEPLHKVTIAQNPNLDNINFDLKKTKAFVGTSPTKENTLTLASVEGSQRDKPGQVAIVFETPVQPGTTVTIQLKARQNPEEGIYEFGVTTYPVEQNSEGEFLGYGRLTFYGSD